MRFLIISYWSVALSHLIGIAISMDSLVIWSKAFIIPLLMLKVLFMRQSGETPKSESSILLIALLFAWLGDLLLSPLFNQFLPGLGAFLIMQILYIIINTSKIANNKRGLIWRKPAYALPLLLFLGTFYYIAFQQIQAPLTIPVCVYGTILTGMVISAQNLFTRLRSTHGWMIFGGALLFLISDAFIGFNKFIGIEGIPQWGVSFLIMSTYVSAQFLIVRGYILSNFGKE